MAEQTIDKRSLPTELRQLPIFQVIGNQLPAAVKTPQGKKTIASLFFWIALIGGSFAFFKALPRLIEYAQMTVWLIVLSIVIVILLMLYPKIVSLIYNAGRILLFKGEKSLARRNPIETLELLNIDAKDTLKKVREKIASVDGVRINMIDEAVRAKDDAEKKYSQVKNLTEEAGRLEREATEMDQKGFVEKANAMKRDAKETRVNATLRMEEGKASEQNARQYTQYGNQFAKVLEVLKDNESASRIYVNAMGSTITIVSKKLEATSKMTSATEGLAEVFQIKDGWKYQQAMDAATSLISQNIGRIRSNLEFLDQNQSITLGSTVSQSELENFVKQIDSGKLETLNISEMSDSSYELSTEQKADKGFNILD
jgi:low affinity Fe/Cu permease